MVEYKNPGSTPWLPGLIGQAWAPQPASLSSERMQAMARRGLSRPEEMTARDIMELCASVIAHGVRPPK